MSPKYDVTMIGGGIIGLATALQLAARFPSLKMAVVEKETELASHQTGHTSGVIHSGIYYRPGSLKARLCVAGGRLLKDFCDQHNIKYQLTGKVIVATDQAELPALETLHHRGTANEVEGLEMIGTERLRELEPHTSGVKALYAPKTGTVDFQEVARAYAAEIRGKGVEILTGAKVVAIARSDSGLRLATTRGEVSTAHLINCAGLYSDTIAKMAGLRPDIRIIPFRGEYYQLASRREHLARGLIYPVPNPRLPFLGVHFIRMFNGGVEAGPNAVLALARQGYRKRDIHLGELLGTLAFPGFWAMATRHWRTGLGEVYRSLSKKAFARSLQRLVPEIQSQDLTPGGAGVRAQAVNRRGILLDDFSIVESENAIHVLNAPSPAATASLAIGQHIAGLAGKSFALAP
ncbi:MAG: L-2-hydroxyglutarate oxidase [Chloroflexi bacterium]|nr:L-2-hydroxyglutarate oxidase [Chloroflexota bacterium]